MKLYTDFPVGGFKIEQYTIVALGGSLSERFYGAGTLPEAETIAARLQQEPLVTMVAICRTLKAWVVEDE